MTEPSLPCELRGVVYTFPVGFRLNIPESVYDNDSAVLRVLVSRKPGAALTELWTKRNSRMLVECPDCEALVEAAQIAVYEWGDEDEPPTTITLLKCPKCYRPMLASERGTELLVSTV